MATETKTLSDLASLKGETAADAERSGDMMLLQVSDAPQVMTVTFSPIEDSLKSLENAEGGDEIPDEELEQRFVTPYLDEKGAMVKAGHAITLVDENGKKLEFMVSEVVLEGEEEGAEGGCLFLLSVSVYIRTTRGES